MFKIMNTAYVKALRLKGAQCIGGKGRWPVWLKPRKQGGERKERLQRQEQEDHLIVPELVNQAKALTLSPNQMKASKSIYAGQ